MSSSNTHTVIIPAPLAGISVGLRETCGKYAVKTGKGYHVATELHYLSFFCILKSWSPNSGMIINWTDNLEELKAISNLSRRAVYSYIKKLHALGLIIPSPSPVDRREKYKSFRMISWDKLADKYNYSGHQYKDFITVTYEKNNELHHPKYLIVQAEIQANQTKQAYMIAKKSAQFKQNSANGENKIKVATSAKECLAIAKQTLEKWCALYQNLPIDKSKSAVDLDDTKQFMSTINPAINRGLWGFKRSYNFKQIQRSSYLKKQLVRRGFGVFESLKFLSPVMNRAPKYSIVNHEGDYPTIEKRQMKAIYDPHKKFSGVWLPDAFKSKINAA